MPNQIDQEIGARVRRRRESLGMTRATVAGALSLDAETVQSFEDGERRMSAKQLQQLCGILEAPPSCFLVDDDETWGERPSERDSLLNDAHRLYRGFFQIQSAELRSILADLAESFAKGGRSSELIEAARLLRPDENLDDNISRLRALNTGPWSH
jgi:transcriptional regulator with XRE-family HTH domain